MDFKEDIEEIEHYFHGITDRLDKIREQNETRGEFFLRVNRKGELPATNETIATPFLGTMLVCESLATNGIPKKSPGYALRTNTGFLVAAVAAEAFGQEPFNGASTILPGEFLVFEPEAKGFYDFSISFKIVPFVRNEAINPDYGDSPEVVEINRGKSKHEIDRDFPNNHYDRQLDMFIVKENSGS